MTRTSTQFFSFYCTIAMNVHWGYEAARNDPFLSLCSRRVLHPTDDPPPPFVMTDTQTDFLGWEYTRGRGKLRSGTASSAQLLLKNVFRFMQDETSMHTAHEEGNSSDLPYFDLSKINGSDCSSL